MKFSPSISLPIHVIEGEGMVTDFKDTTHSSLTKFDASRVVSERNTVLSVDTKSTSSRY